MAVSVGLNGDLLSLVRGLVILGTWPSVGPPCPLAKSKWWLLCLLPVCVLRNSYDGCHLVPASGNVMQARGRKELLAAVSEAAR